MILIPDDNTLREFIPNTMAPAMGDTPMFAKISPFLVAAERWLIQNFIPEHLLKQIVEDATDSDDPLYFLPRRIVVLRAWMNALPAVDVVVSPSGVGVIETASMKPASKAKIENLIKANADELDYNIECLINIIYRIPGWLDSRQADKFRNSLFPDFSILDVLGYQRERYKNWLTLTARASMIERRMAREWISVPVMARLRAERLARTATGELAEVAGIISGAVIEELRTGIENREAMEDATSLIRSNKTLFPEWHTSDTANRFSGPGYVNKKNDKGFWL